MKASKIRDLIEALQQELSKEKVLIYSFDGPIIYDQDPFYLTVRRDGQYSQPLCKKLSESMIKDLSEYKDYLCFIDEKSAHVFVNEQNSRSFSNELTALINSHSKESASNTPDFILAEYIENCLNAFNKASQTKDYYFNPPAINDCKASNSALKPSCPLGASPLG